MRCSYVNKEVNLLREEKVYDISRLRTFNTEYLISYSVLCVSLFKGKSNKKNMTQ